MSLKEEVLKKINLQLFSDNNPEGGEEEISGSAEFVAPTSQSELDSTVNKAVQAALANAKTKWESEAAELISAAKTQAEQLASMTAEEKAAALEKDRMSKLAEREAALTSRELKATAIDVLIDREMPKQLADLLTYTDAENVTKQLDSLESAFKESVKNEVDKRLLNSSYVPGAIGSAGNGSKAGERGKALAQKNTAKQTESSFFKN